MMENGTTTPFLVKKRVKGGESGGTVLDNSSSYSGKSRSNGNFVVVVMF